MSPNIRVEQYEIKNQGTFDGAKWLTKYDVKIQFADRDVAYAMKDRIDKFLQDEAFDDLAKRQGDWGGGFQAKRAMAADKDALFQKFEVEQPAQEPVAHVYLFDHEGRPLIAWDNAKGIKIGDKLYTAPPPKGYA